MATSPISPTSQSGAAQISALDLFTGRGDIIRRFSQYMNEDTPQKILFLYGKEGSGKSLLLRFLKKYCSKQLGPDMWAQIKDQGDEVFMAQLKSAQSIKPVPTALLDFGIPLRGNEQPQDAFCGLLMLRRSLMGYNLPFPLFDFACIWYLNCVNKLTDELLRKLFPDEVKDVVDWIADDFRGVSFKTRAERLLKFFDNDWRRRYKPYKESLKKSEIEELKKSDPEMSLVNLLPRFFAEDLGEALPLNGIERVALFFDTHNAFWSETEQETVLGNLFHLRDEWVRRLLIELLIPKGIIPVVADSLISRWAGTDRVKIPEESLEMSQIEYLPEAAAEQFLISAGIGDAALQQAILSSARRTETQVEPLSLALCVDVVTKSQGRNAQFTPDVFSTIKASSEDRVTALAEKLLHYQETNTGTALLALSVCRAFDRNIFDKLGKEINFQVTDAVFDAVIKYSFISRFKDGAKFLYSIHDEMRKALWENDPDLVLRAHTALHRYFNSEFKAGDIIAESEAIYHANRVNWESGVRMWVESFDAATQDKNYRRCRRLLEVCRELIFGDGPKEIYKPSYWKGRVSQAKGSYYDSLSLLQEAKEEYAEAFEAYDKIKSNNDGDFLKNKQCVLLRTGRLRNVRLHEWKLDPLEFQKHKDNSTNGKPPKRVSEESESEKSIQEKLALARNLPELDRFVEQICHLQGSYLVTGHRGVGKTSYINYALFKAAEKLRAREPATILIPVLLNIARNYEEKDSEKLMIRVIRGLYNTMSESKYFEALPPELRKKLKYAYLKTAAKVSENAKEALKTTLGFSETITTALQAEISGEGGYKVFTKLAGKLGMSRTKARTRSMTSENAREFAFALEYLAYDREIAESELINLIHDLNGITINIKTPRQISIPRPFPAFWRALGRISGRDYLQESVLADQPHKLHLAFIFDEMDKIDLAGVKKLMPLLKELLLTSKATFIFIGGESVASNWLMREDPEGDIAYGIFASMLYVPLFTEDEFKVLAKTLLHDANIDFPNELLEHLMLHSYGTPREFFRQLLQFINWEEKAPILSIPPNLIPPPTNERLYNLVREVNSQIGEDLPNEIKDHLKRSVDKWLIIAERAGGVGFTEKELCQSALVTIPTADNAEPVDKLGGYWQQKTTNHFKRFFKIMLDSNAFKKMPQFTKENLYMLNSEDFTLGQLRRFAGATPFPTEGTGISQGVDTRQGAPSGTSPVSMPMPTETGTQAGSSGIFPGARPEPPSLPPVFIGRSNDLQAVQQAVDRSALVQIVGIPGVGKTMLAKAIANNLRSKFTDGVVWIDVIDGTTPETALKQIIESFGVQTQETALNQLEAQARSTLANKKALIVFNDAERLEKLPLVGGNDSPTIITSRRHFATLSDMGSTYQLPELSEEDGITLLQRAFDQSPTQDDSASKVCALLGFHPLAINIAGQLARNQSLTISDLEQKLRQSENIVSYLKLPGVDAPEGDLELSFKRSYMQLSETEQKVFRTAGVFAGAFEAVTVASLVEEEKREQVPALLENLAEVSMLTRSERGYVMHPLIRAYAAALAKENKELSELELKRATLIEELLGQIPLDKGKSE
jgi:hypothetical protein